MENKTFTREIKFKSNILEDGAWVKKVVVKTATFKELSEDDPAQHNLIFMSSPLFIDYKHVGGKSQVIADPMVSIDIAKEAIECLLILNEDFNIQDKTEFLNNAFAVSKFANWFINNKFTAFFLNSIVSY